MLIEFGEEELEIFYTTPLDEIRGKLKYPVEVLKQYKRKVQLLIALKRLDELRNFRGLNFEYLKGNRKGECSIRLNDQYRLILIPTLNDKIQIVIIKEISKHYE